MTQTVLPLWKNCFELATWLGRNCTACRWRDSDPTTQRADEICPLPGLALKSVVKNQPMPTQVLTIMFPQFHYAYHGYPSNPPHKCGSRIDKRGRKPWA